MLCYQRSQNTICLPIELEIKQICIESWESNKKKIRQCNTCKWPEMHDNQQSKHYTLHPNGRIHGHKLTIGQQ
jgi:hypothetical protein